MIRMLLPGESPGKPTQHSSERKMMLVAKGMAGPQLATVERRLKKELATAAFAAMRKFGPGSPEAKRFLSRKRDRLETAIAVKYALLAAGLDPEKKGHVKTRAQVRGLMRKMSDASTGFQSHPQTGRAAVSSNEAVVSPFVDAINTVRKKMGQEAAERFVEAYMRHGLEIGEVSKSILRQLKRGSH